MTLGDAEKIDSAPAAAASAAGPEAAAPETVKAAAAIPEMVATSSAEAEKDPSPAKKRAREPSSDEAAGESEAAADADDDAETEEDKETTKKARASSPPPKKKAARPPKKPQGDEKAENPKKRKSPAAKKSQKDVEAATAAAAADEGEETESEPEKQPKKRAKPAAAKEKKSPARKKKPAKEVVESSDSEDEEQQEVLRRVEALDPEVTAKFGSIVWAKMVGFPFWPAMITDPRLLPSRLQASAVKDLETKYLVYFYSTKNFAPTLFKNIAAWDDTKNDYRSGFPAKDSKAPKRRAQLMEAIAEADKDLLLPIEERVNGLLKPSEKEPKAKKSAREEGAGSKSGGKHLVPKAKKSGLKAAAERKSAKKTNAGKDVEDDEETVDERSQESHEEDEENPVARAMSKDEIKAKVASRKTPSKKKVAGDDAETKAKAGGAAKKAGGGAGKSSGKAASASDEIDTKRKKEIELMVPRKSVKSADIREMTEEAAKKSLAGGAKGKPKSDKGDYTVGDLNSFAVKLTRLHMNESSKNNDEIIRMLTQLFEEKLVYRSDVERSGIASTIAQLRKSSNPTVAQTASAVRKHMIVIMVHDTGAEGDKSVGSAPKAGASESDSKPKKHKEPKSSEKTSDVKSESVATTQKAVNGAKKAKSAPKDADVKKEGDAASTEKAPVEASKRVATVDTPRDEASGVAEGTPKPDGRVASVAAASSGVSSLASEVVATEKPGGGGVTDEATAAAIEEIGSSATPAAENRDSSVQKADASLDAHRQAFIDMLSSVLDPSGAAHVNLAAEIEEFVFDRYKESNDDYRVQARKITFGLKKNTNLRERLISGALHGLELVYADDKFFEASP